MAEATDNQVVNDPGPGVHVVVHPEPLRAGRAVAHAIGAHLIDLPAMAESAVAQRRRLPAARSAQARLDALEQQAADIGGDPSTDKALVGRRFELEGLARRRILDDATADRLHVLGVELAGLETVLARTRQRQHERYARELGLPVPDPPSPIAQSLSVAAAAVLAEEAAVADARQSLALLPGGPDEAPPTPPAAPPDDELEPVARWGGLPIPDEWIDDPDHPRPDLSSPDAWIDVTGGGEDAGGSDGDQGDGDATHVLPVADHRDGDDEAAEAFAATDEDPLSSLPAHDGSVLMPLGIFFIGLFIAIVVLLTGLSTIVAVVAIVLALAAAGLSRYSIKSESAHASDLRDASEARRVALATRPEPAPVRPKAKPAKPTKPAKAERSRERRKAPAAAAPPAARLDEAARRRRALDDAEARLAAARQAWDSVAATTDEPHDVHDPGPDGPPPLPTDALVAANPAVRALTATHRTMRSEWRLTWAELGRVAPPPDPAVIDLLLADLRETAPDPREAEAMLTEVSAANRRESLRAAFDEVLGGDVLEDLRAAAPDADDLDDTPLVLVAPFANLGQRRRVALRRQLEDLEADLTVVVVVQTAKDVPTLNGGK